MSTTDDLAADVMYGVREIADFLGWEGEAGERRVYHLRERGKAPIRKRAGVGYYALRSELKAWFIADETLSSNVAA